MFSSVSLSSDNRVYLYDTTLRDGAQTEGIDFSVTDKGTIAGWLDAMGFAFVEGGWPGANPTDTTFFTEPPTLSHARLTAFGMTCRCNKEPEEDEGLLAVVTSPTKAVCLVGKTWDTQVTEALGFSLADNLHTIRKTMAFAKAQGKEALFDAEHFFDGYKSNPAYALDCLRAALEGGASWLVLCDTRGATLPHDVAKIVSEVHTALPAGAMLGFHGHNDKGCAVANSLEAVRCGCRMVQGTLAGLGERCGNADLLALIPTLVFDGGYDVGLSPEAMKSLTQLSHDFAALLGRDPDKNAPYVGASAFAHKGGLHASAVAKNPTFYEHMTPETVGNRRKVLMSNQAGLSNVRHRLEGLGIEVDDHDPALPGLLAAVKEHEHQGYAFDRAPASFAVLALRKLGRLQRGITVTDFTIDKKGSLRDGNEPVTLSTASVTVQTARGPVTRSEDGNGSVDALDKALRTALNGDYPELMDVRLVDYQVRILNGSAATGATTRVWVEVEDTAQQRRWASVGVSPDLVGASLVALLDAYNFRLAQDTFTAQATPRREALRQRRALPGQSVSAGP